MYLAHAASVSDITAWRDEFRQSASGQLVHDSLHGREGWTRSYLLNVDGTQAGYGAVAVGGPWQGTVTVFEFHISNAFQIHAAELFRALLRISGATHFEIQTHPPLLHQLADRYVKSWTTDRIIYRDERATCLPTPSGAVLGKVAAADKDYLFKHRVEPVGDWVVRRESEIVATGGWFSHYNPPYRDLFMEVAEPYRKRGIGSWLLQEMKHACRKAGGIPCARCHPENEASRACLAKAGFTPWCEILTSPVVNAP